MIFPADRSLMRTEDGVALPDGRLIVADQAHGLRLVLADGSKRPFGSFAEAGYVHRPPHAAAGANGVTLEPAGTHILVADLHHGAIYRVDVGSEDTELLYQHSFGVNVARRDSRGGVWFSQSTPVPDGAVYYLPPASGGDARATTALEVSGPDNVELDPPARLWIAGALRSEIVVLDLDSGVARSVFRIATPRSEELILEVERRLQAGTPILDLLGPDLGEPAPGSITGLILSPDGGPVYVTNLGNALIRLER